MCSLVWVTSRAETVLPILGLQPTHSKMTGTPAIAVGVIKAAVSASVRVS